MKRFFAEATAAAQRRVWLEPSAERLLNESDWPGNVRQLKGAIQRVVALSVPGPISEETLRPFLSLQTQGAEEEEPTGELNEIERRQILRVLQETGGNKTKAAEILGIQRRTLYKKLARLERGRELPPRAIPETAAYMGHSMCLPTRHLGYLTHSPPVTFRSGLHH